MKQQNLQQRLANACNKILETQSRYKRNYYNRFGRDRTLTKPEDHVFVRVDRKDEKKPDKNGTRSRNTIPSGGHKTAKKPSSWKAMADERKRFTIVC